MRPILESGCSVLDPDYEGLIDDKAVVAGAAGPASAGPLFWSTMVSAVPLFSIAAAVLTCLCSSNRLILNESRLIDGIIINNQNSCHQGKGAKTNIT